MRKNCLLAVAVVLLLTPCCNVYVVLPFSVDKKKGENVLFRGSNCTTSTINSVLKTRTTTVYNISLDSYLDFVFAEVNFHNYYRPSTRYTVYTRWLNVTRRPTDPVDGPWQYYRYLCRSGHHHCCFYTSSTVGQTISFIGSCKSKLK